MKAIKRKTATFVTISALLGGAFTYFSACSTSEIKPPPPLPEVPEYVKVPHPEGLDMADLKAIFATKEAPPRESIKECKANVTKLRSLVANNEELSDGTRELIQSDPVQYHWCFYGSLLELEEQLKEASYLDERQKFVIGTYLFLTPVARAFLVEFGDSRYLRWAISRYRRLSEFVFYRHVDLDPQMSSDLVAYSADPLGFIRQPKDDDKGDGAGVLNKYGLSDKNNKAPLYQSYGGKKLRGPASLMKGARGSETPVTDVDDVQAITPSQPAAAE